MTKELFLTLVVTGVLLVFNDGSSVPRDSVRLIRKDRWSGVLQVYLNKGWRTVGMMQTDGTAVVACRSLSLPTNNAMRISSSAFRDTRGRFWELRLHMDCYGNETHLLDCKYRYYNASRNRPEEVALSCDPELEFGFGHAGPALTRASLASIFYNETWSTICKLSDPAAYVYCKSVGLETAHAHSIDVGHIKAGHGKGLISNVDCDGREGNILQCSNRHWGPYYCPKGLAAVSCVDKVPFRLTRGNRTFGQLEVMYYRSWGSVCNECFGPKEATVACRSLGLPSSAATLLSEDDLDDQLPSHMQSHVILSHVRCKGDELNLADCNKTIYKAYQCTMGRPVYLRCAEGRTEIETKLVGTEAMSGGVLLKYNGEWGKICLSRTYDKRFSQLDAKVICRSLGFPTEFARKSSFTGEVVYKAWFSELNCHGEEDNLFECYHSGTIDHSCSRASALGISCSAPLVQDQEGYREQFLIASLSTVAVLVVIAIAGIIYYCFFRRKRLRQDRIREDGTRVQYDCTLETIDVQIPSRYDDLPPKYEELFPPTATR